jgi:hypothetical protein
LTDRDGFVEVFEDLPKFVAALSRARSDPVRGPMGDDRIFGRLTQLEPYVSTELNDELIIGDDYVTYLIYSPVCDPSELLVFSRDGGIEVRAGELTTWKPLQVPVDGEDAEAELRNGVLSVKLRILEDRERGA